MESDDLVRRFGAAVAGLPGECRVADGEWIVREGDEDDRLFIVLDGEAVVEKAADAPRDEASRREVVDIIGPGGVFGELSFIDGRPRSASVRARGPLRLMTVSRAEFERAAAEHPSQAVEMMSLLLGVLSARVRESTETLVTLAETGRRLAAARGPDELAEVLMARVTRAVPLASAGIVARITPAGCHPVVAFGLPATLPVPLPIAPAGAFAATLAAHPEGLVVGPGSAAAADLAFFECTWILVSGSFNHGALDGFVAVMSNAIACPFTLSHQTALAIATSQAAAALSQTSSR